MLSLSKSHLSRILPILSDRQKSLHLIFRLLGPELQTSYSSSPILQKAPKAFIHGNPHLDNYVRTFHGSGMVDFDRSRIGPYCWDLIRLFSSFQICSKAFPNPLHPKIIHYTLKGYKNTFSNPHILYSEPSFLNRLQPKKHQFTTKQYLRAQKKWAGKLQKHQVPHDTPEIEELLSLYLKSRKEKQILKFFQIKKAARCNGSLGKEHILIYLEPIKQKQNRDSILIDIKETYCEKDTKLFYSPTEHQGLRMIQASNLYAPNIEQRLGHCTYNNIHYWGREVPVFNAKIKTLLLRRELEELGYSVGAQLGRAHRLSLRTSPADLKKHLQKNEENIIALSRNMTQIVIGMRTSLLKRNK